MTDLDHPVDPTTHWQPGVYTLLLDRGAGAGPKRGTRLIEVALTWQTRAA
jgi:hypothetical protein